MDAVRFEHPAQYALAVSFDTGFVATRQGATVFLNAEQKAELLAAAAAEEAADNGDWEREAMKEPTGDEES